MKTRKILSDHKKQGKTFIPPFTHMLGPMGEVSWIKTIFPELLWIALIHNMHGDRRAVEIITQFSRLARKIKSHPDRKWFATTSPSSWNGHIAPLLLRAMADVYINFAWVLCDPGDRAKKFILYGLGQAKLELEHRRADLASREAKVGELERIQIQEDWINKQRATFLTDVNVGSWSGISTRTMADEAGCIDFYNYVYTPFSACTHST
jgi:hypothetical protein